MYRKLIVVLALIITINCYSQVEQLDRNPEMSFNKHYFYLNPFNLFANQFQLGYERDFDKAKSSILVSASVIVSDPGGWVNLPTFGTTQEFHYRFKALTNENFVNKRGRRFRFDFYMGPFLASQYLQRDNLYFFDDPQGGPTTEINSTEYTYALSTGMLIGPRFKFQDRISIDFNIGGALKYSLVKPEQPAANPYFGNTYTVHRMGYTGIVPKSNFQIGISF